MPELQGRNPASECGIVVETLLFLLGEDKFPDVRLGTESLEEGGQLHWFEDDIKHSTDLRRSHDDSNVAKSDLIALDLDGHGSMTAKCCHVIKDLASFESLLEMIRSASRFGWPPGRCRHA